MPGRGCGSRVENGLELALSPDEPRWCPVTRRHAEHFLACIRGLEKPRATAVTAHRATNIAHLGNLSLDLKRSLTWDPQTDSTQDAAPAGLGRDPRAGYRLSADR
jgi:hypothetical protein